MPAPGTLRVYPATIAPAGGPQPPEAPGGPGVLTGSGAAFVLGCPAGGSSELVAAAVATKLAYHPSSPTPAGEYEMLENPAPASGTIYENFPNV